MFIIKAFCHHGKRYSLACHVSLNWCLEAGMKLLMNRQNLPSPKNQRFESAFKFIKLFCMSQKRICNNNRKGD